MSAIDTERSTPAGSPPADAPPAPGPGGEAGAEPREGSERAARDRPPRKRSKGKPGGNRPGELKGAVRATANRKLQAKLAELLQFPAVPVVMFAPDAVTQAYMLEHFTRSGPRTAEALVEAADTNPELRQLLERITTGGSMFAVVLALLTYAAPPVLWTIGMREQAAGITRASTLTEADLEAMMAAANAAAQSEATHAAAAANGGAANAAPPSATADAGDGQPAA